jgi:hypothetical protein
VFNLSNTSHEHQNLPVHGNEKALDFKHILKNISPISEVILLLVSVHSNLVLTYCMSQRLTWHVFRTWLSECLCGDTIQLVKAVDHQVSHH